MEKVKPPTGYGTPQIRHQIKGLTFAHQAGLKGYWPHMFTLAWDAVSLPELEAAWQQWCLFNIGTFTQPLEWANYFEIGKGIALVESFFARKFLAAGVERGVIENMLRERDSARTI